MTVHHQPKVQRCYGTATPLNQATSLADSDQRLKLDPGPAKCDWKGGGALSQSMSQSPNANQEIRPPLEHSSPYGLRMSYAQDKNARAPKEQVSVLKNALLALKGGLFDKHKTVELLIDLLDHANRLLSSRAITRSGARRPDVRCGFVDPTTARCV